jgi:hypothetical protein
LLLLLCLRLCYATKILHRQAEQRFKDMFIHVVLCFLSFVYSFRVSFQFGPRETVRHGFAVLFMLVAVLAVSYNMSEQRNALSKPVSVLFGAR